MVAVRKDYAAPTGLENFMGGSSTKISLLTELGHTQLCGRTRTKLLSFDFE